VSPGVPACERVQLAGSELSTVVATLGAAELSTVVRGKGKHTDRVAGDCTTGESEARPGATESRGHSLGFWF
jgi:hypothetical protein